MTREFRSAYGLAFLFRALTPVLLLMLCFAPETYSQARPKQWHFGRNAAINFFGGSPMVMMNSNMNTPEGCASYSDGAGILAFYTNGVTVWNSSNNVMTNGTGLKGHPLSTQSALALPQPGTPVNVYLFTLDAAAGPNGFCYSIVNSNSQSISATDKNIQVRTNVTEKMTAARHCNGKDFWVIVHDWNSDAFQAYLLNKNGLDSLPVTSNTGSIHTGALSNCDGYMKVSPKNDKIALAITGSGKVELFNFDNLSGQVEFQLALTGYGDPYGIEFSPSGERLYFTCASGELYEVNLQDTSNLNIINSTLKIATSTSLLGAVQRAPDGKLYVARDLSQYLGVINSPNSFGTNAQYLENGLYLGGNRSEGGLPPNIPDPWQPNIIFSGKCLGDTFMFSFSDTLHIDSIIWNFGDPFSDSLNTSRQWHPGHYYPMPGTYRVVAIYFYCDTLDSLVLHVPVMDTPKPNLGPDTSLCSADPYLLSPGPGFITYLWHDGFTLPSRLAITTGLYWVEVTNLCGTGRDSVNILNIFTSPTLNVMNDTSLCEGDSVYVWVDTTGYHLVWHDNTHEPGRWLSPPGTYFVQITDTNWCKATDQFTLTQIAYPEIWLGNDTTICEGDMLILSVNAGFLTYQWFDGSSGPSNTITTEGLVTLTVANECGSDSDSLFVELEDCTATLYLPNTFTPNGDGVNDVFGPKGQFIADFTLHIYNRWGQLVFRSASFNQGWDGMVDGMLAPSGAYAWQVSFTTEYGHEGSLYGFVLLLR